MTYKDRFISFIHKADKLFSTDMEMSENKKYLLGTLSELLDQVVKTSYCDNVEFYASESGNLTVEFMGEDIEIQNGRSNPFFSVAGLADAVNIRSEDDKSFILFVFHNIWELKSVE